MIGKLFYLFLILSLFFLNSCSNHSRQKKFERQAIRDAPAVEKRIAKAREEERAAKSNGWGIDPYAYGKPQSFGSGERDLNFNLYYNDPAFKELGFDLMRNNAAVYRDYYKERCKSWKTLWGLL